EVVLVPTADGQEWTITIAPERTSSIPFEIASAAPIGDTPLTTAVATPQPESIHLVSAAVAQADGAAPAAVAETPAVPVESVEHGVAIVSYPSSVPEAAAYERVYNAIPFNRTEYLANPSYRHETAMELLTGNQRQIVVNRTYTPKLHGPTERSPLFLYNRYGGYYGGGMGYGGPSPYGFGYPFNYTPGYPPAFRYFLPLEDLY
ncbi:MAG: hypothetical protein AB7U20_02015, partial [Planctomycetaceae bacterium]